MSLYYLPLPSVSVFWRSTSSCISNNCRSTHYRMSTLKYLISSFPASIFSVLTSLLEESFFWLKILSSQRLDGLALPIKIMKLARRKQAQNIVRLGISWKTQRMRRVKNGNHLKPQPLQKTTRAKDQDIFTSVQFSQQLRNLGSYVLCFSPYVVCNIDIFLNSRYLHYN